jgi:hypothetical protein
MHPERARALSRRGTRTVVELADDYAHTYAPFIRAAVREVGHNYRQVAKWLTRERIPAQRAGQWKAQSVKNLVVRYWRLTGRRQVLWDTSNSRSRLALGKSAGIGSESHMAEGKRRYSSRHIASRPRARLCADQVRCWPALSRRNACRHQLCPRQSRRKKHPNINSFSQYEHKPPCKRPGEAET